MQLALHALSTAPDGADTLGTDTLQKWRHWACTSQRRSAQEEPALENARAIISKIDGLLDGWRQRARRGDRQRKHKRPGNKDKRSTKKR